MQTSERVRAGASIAAKKTKTTTTTTTTTNTATRTVDGVTGEIVQKQAVSSERAFADFVFGSLILHGFCINFIN
jgi:oligosaccharyltransferase complex subunit epsilon